MKSLRMRRDVPHTSSPRIHHRWCVYERAIIATWCQCVGSLIKTAHHPQRLIKGAHRVA